MRYGTLADGEQIVASNPPTGVVGSADFESLDRFTVTYDAPNYVRIDEIAVVVSGGDLPVVTKTRRPLNSDPQTVEIVLDRPMTIGETTTFTFSDGVAESVVAYTIDPTGACCTPDGQCEVTNPPTCANRGGSFTENTACGVSAACCLAGGGCEVLSAPCCVLANGAQVDDTSLCEGDVDGDRLDGVCGDACPGDPAKSSPGVCGCGVSDIDSDGDTVPDCNDQCEGHDDLIDDDGNHVPDCLEFIPIPTVSNWGLIVLTLLIAIVSKIAFRGRIRAALL